MGLGGFLRKLFGGAGPGRGVADLAQRLEVTPEALARVEPRYREFAIPKRRGGTRRIAAPEPELKALQRRVLRRVLAGLRTHPAALGFERGRSIVDHARHHLRPVVLVRLDLRDFFPATGARRVEAYFRAIGWNREAAAMLTRLCTHAKGLPQGAPTSPRLSNLVNIRMDARLAGLARKHHAVYSRYADDLAFSFDRDDRARTRAVIRAAKRIVADFGYALHTKRKLHIRRRYEQQRVTGLVVNEKIALPRAVRRRLRAVEHHLAHGRPATLTPAQFAGWQAFRAMVENRA